MAALELKSAPLWSPRPPPAPHRSVAPKPRTTSRGRDFTVQSDGQCAAVTPADSLLPPEARDPPTVLKPFTRAFGSGLETEMYNLLDVTRVLFKNKTKKLNGVVNYGFTKIAFRCMKP